VKLDGHTKGVYSCGWSPLHRIIVSGGADKTVCLFNPFSGKKQATLEGHRAGVSDVMVNDKDHQIISVEGLGKVRM
jgi:WD40 repeat protein